MLVEAAKEFFMTKSAEVELKQLKSAVNYLIGLLEEGTLVDQYDPDTRDALAVVLEQLLEKVEGLPEDVPQHLVQAAAVRAIIAANDLRSDAEHQELVESLNRHMREAEASASIQGHVLGPWEQVSGSEMEYQATCQNCGGFVYVSHSSTYDLLLDSCSRVHMTNQ